MHRNLILCEVRGKYTLCYLSVCVCEHNSEYVVLHVYIGRLWRWPSGGGTFRDASRWSQPRVSTAVHETVSGHASTPKRSGARERQRVPWEYNERPRDWRNQSLCSLTIGYKNERDRGVTVQSFLRSLETSSPGQLACGYQVGHY